MNWRPEGWVNPNAKTMDTDNGPCSNTEWDAFEAGADAMLEALRKAGLRAGLYAIGYVEVVSDPGVRIHPNDEVKE